MTAQTPERIIIDGRPQALYEQPLYPLLASRRMDLKDDSSGFSTACHRRYLGTWEIRNGTLYLVHLNMVVPDEEPLTPQIRQRLFRAVPCTGFPIKADWFNGIRIAFVSTSRSRVTAPQMGHVWTASGCQGIDHVAAFIAVFPPARAATRTTVSRSQMCAGSLS